MSNQSEYKKLSFITEIKATSDSRVFEAYASTFGNVDSYNDVIVKGAFLNTIQNRKPKLAYQHDTTRLPGVIDSVMEDDKGLLVKGRLAETELGNEVYELLKLGAINQMSIGFVATEVEYKEDVRLLKSIDLYEVSFVTFPANEEAIVTRVKSKGEFETIRDYEKALRDVLGLSRNQAKLFAAHGFKSSEDIQRDAELLELKETIENLTNKIRG